MQATGIWEQIETQNRREAPLSLSESFKKRFPENETNIEILKNIEKFEKLGQAPEEIIVTLHIPDVIVTELKQDFPNLHLQTEEQADKKK